MTTNPETQEMRELIASRRFAEVRLLDALAWAAYAADIVRAVAWAQNKHETWHDATCSWHGMEEAIRRESEGASNDQAEPLPPDGERGRH